MAQLVEQVRHVCALGALQTVQAIDRAVPILHAGPGCGQKLWNALAVENGCQGSGYIGGHSVPSTNASEKEIIFGGDVRLREVVENSFKVLDADLYVVLTGCTSDIVGDNVGDVVRSFQDQGKPIIFAETGGFKGTNIYGHELVLDAIIDQYLPETAGPVEPGLVNIWSVVPYHDAFWTGNLKAIGQLISQIGLTPNIIFGPGPGRGIKALNKVPQAQFNLLISPWVGLRNVRHLAEKYQTPYLHYPALPIGPTETGRFLRTVAQFAGISGEFVDQLIQESEDDYYYYIERSADILLETRLMPRRFITIADSFYTLGISRFLINDLGLLPEPQFITDDTPPEYQESIAAEFDKFIEAIKAPVVFANDGGEIHQQLRGINYHSRPLILGSSWERVLAKELNGYQLSISLPVTDRMVLNRSYVGYGGAQRLIEDIYTVVLQDFQ
jgi:nitrogenase molybdenum-iron protein beta chain